MVKIVIFTKKSFLKEPVIRCDSRAFDFKKNSERAKNEYNNREIQLGGISAMMDTKKSGFYIYTFRNIKGNPMQILFFYEDTRPWEALLIDEIEKTLEIPLVVRNDEGIFVDNIVREEHYFLPQMTDYIEENDTDFMKAIDRIAKGLKVDRILSYEIRENKINEIVELKKIEDYYVSEFFGTVKKDAMKAIKKRGAIYDNK